MTMKTTAKTLCAGLRSNAGMIRVYESHADGTCSVRLRTFRVDSVLRFLRRKPLSRYSVRQ